MAPPTGASDSILILRLNGASVDRCQGALGPHLQNYSMAANENRVKKNWGDKWNMTRSGKSGCPIESQMIESSSFMVHPDYLNKYGTLSNGVLNKSVKYAETRLYGTVGVRPAPTQRPSLFLYPAVVGPPPRLPPNQSSYLSSPANLLAVPIFNYVSSEANGRLHSSSVGTRKVPDQTKTGCGCPDVKITSRNGTVRSKSLSKDTISGREKRIRASVQPLDPYNLMRRSRLGNIEIVETSATGGQSKRRNASASPVERRSRESTSSPLETFKPKLAGKEVKLWKNREEEVSRRKSILECDVDVYELNKSKSKDFEDSTDELNLSDPTVDDSGNVSETSRPKSNKTDRSNGSVGKSQVTNHKVEHECSRNSEVRLNGQRFKIFEDSDRSPRTADEFSSDSEKTGKGFGASDSPKRPPRRPKEKGSADPGFKYTKLRSKSSPNLSIKSILKKHSKAGEGGDLSMLDFPVADLEVVPGLNVSPICRAVTDDPQPSPPEQPNFQGTLKKKKQVQFRVNNSYESLDESNDVPVEAKTKDLNLPKFSQKTETTIDEDDGEKSIDRSKSCDDLSTIESKKEEAVNKKEKVEITKEVFSNAEPVELKRSYSDRRLTSALVLPGKESQTTKLSSSSSDLFNDTMALRIRTVKPDSRQVFPRSSRFVRKTEVESATNIISNPWTKCSEKLAGNTISYAEFTKLPDKCTPKKENRTSKTGSKKPKVSLKSNIPVKTNTCFPSPPPRHVPTDKSTRSGVKVFVKVPVKDFRKDETEKDSTNGAGRKEPFTIEKENFSEMRPECESEISEGKTIVRLSSNPPDESVEITGPSITIHSKNVAPASKDEPQRRTSLIISNFHGQDSNKVTISVRNESSDDEANPSTCTIIETGSNSTVIPVVSTDNKTTLIVGSQTSVRAISSDCDALGWTSSPKPTRFLFSETHFEANKSVESLDPVEAIKRNLIPHICGKEDGVLTLMQRLRQSRDVADENQIYKNENEEKKSHDNGLELTSKNKKCPSESERHSPKSEKNSPKMTSVDGHTSDSERFADGSKSQDTSHPLADMNFYASTEVEDLEEREKDKLECEYEITNGFRKAESENIYETIKDEPIYDRIRDRSGIEAVVVPPPLPPTQPPASDETEKQKQTTTKSMFEGASKYEILNYLVDAKERVQEESYWSGGTIPEPTDFKVHISSDDKEGIALNKPLETTKTVDVEKSVRCDERPTISENESEPDSASRISSQLSYSSDDNVTVAVAPENDLLKMTKARKSSAEIERNDSGVGSETSHTSRNRWLVSSSIREDPHHLCEDCDQVVETQITDGGVMYVPLVCRKCAKKRSERKEIIQEIVETEEKYGRDLKIILEEFYRPMLVAGLLTPDQLSSIFLNTEELLENSELLTERLRDTLEIAADQGDEDLVTVNVGKLFIDAEPMLHAFETYCIRQGAAAMLLAGLEKEKELLRIFLRVSQMENAVLRRMNLNSFLMVPVQRVTKYPLLLARLYKVTPAQQEGRELLKEAQHNIELHLEHMNSEAKDVSGTKVWRRFSTSAAAGRKFAAESEMINIKLRKMAVDALEWNHEEVRFILEGKLMYTQPTDNNWKRGRTIKLSPIFVLLVTLGKPNSRYRTDPGEDELTFPTKTGIREATLLLVKEKCGRYTLIREPLYLDKTIVCCESEMEEYFEVQELSTKESFIFKAEDGEKTKEWYKQVQYHAQILGAWRKRRNALANIMINGMLTRGCTS